MDTTEYRIIDGVMSEVTADPEAIAAAVAEMEALTDRSVRVAGQLALGDLLLDTLASRRARVARGIDLAWHLDLAREEVARAERIAAEGYLD